jgi:hypothetical protein
MQPPLVLSSLEFSTRTNPARQAQGLDRAADSDRDLAAADEVPPAPKAVFRVGAVAERAPQVAADAARAAPAGQDQER